MKTAICLALLTATLISCNDKKDLTIFPAGCELKTGDIVFRRGGGISSHAVMMADRNGRYSHVGIVVDSAGKKMIVHAVPDEPDFEGDPDRAREILLTDKRQRRRGEKTEGRHHYTAEGSRICHADLPPQHAL